MKLFRDPVYEYISCTDEELRLIDSPWFQRLRHCSQNGPTRLVYPSQLGTRFEHSLGVMELATRTLRSVLTRDKYANAEAVDGFLERGARDLKAFLGIDHTGKPASERHADAMQDLLRVFRFAALCHDIGHFPLSHTLEQSFDSVYFQGVFVRTQPYRAPHEYVSAEIVRILGFEGDNHERLIAPSIARGAILVILAPKNVTASTDDVQVRFEDSVFSTLASVLNGHLDVDNLDYMQRDGHLSGTSFGLVDVERFIDSMMLVEPRAEAGNDPNKDAYRIIPSSRALSTVESALLERYKEYKWVCFHHKALFFDKVAAELGKTLLDEPAVRDGIFSPVEKVADQVRCQRDLERILGTPGEVIPPLQLYDIGGGHFRLNGEFFIKNPDSHFFDDVWYCIKCRGLTDPADRVYVEALVERGKCGITLWKDLSEYRRFAQECAAVAERNAELLAEMRQRLLAKGIETDPKSYVRKFSEVFWSMFPTFSLQTRESLESDIIDAMKDALEERDILRLRPMFVSLNWRKVFGAIEGFRVCGRSGFSVRVTDHSDLLKQLSNFAGEIPLYAFVLGQADDIAEIGEPSRREEVLTAVAEGFINVVVRWLESRIHEVDSVFNETVRTVG